MQPAFPGMKGPSCRTIGVDGTMTGVDESRLVFVAVSSNGGSGESTVGVVPATTQPPTITFEGRKL